jgi:hypothetical protein
MQREHSEPADLEPHVFDQTNGVVDLGEATPPGPEAERGAERNRTVRGIAMLSANRPAG